MHSCCPEFKAALQRGDIVLIVANNEYRMMNEVTDKERTVRYCPYCGKKIEDDAKNQP